MGAVAEPGGDAVDRDLARDELVLEAAAGPDRLRRTLGHPHSPVAARDVERVGDGERGAVELERRPARGVMGMGDSSHEPNVAQGVAGAMKTQPIAIWVQ